MEHNDIIGARGKNGNYIAVVEVTNIGRTKDADNRSKICVLETNGGGSKISGGTPLRGSHVYRTAGEFNYETSAPGARAECLKKADAVFEKLTGKSIATVVEQRQAKEQEQQQKREQYVNSDQYKEWKVKYEAKLAAEKADRMKLTEYEIARAGGFAVKPWDKSASEKSVASEKPIEDRSR